MIVYPPGSGLEESGALISSCGLYRYRLWRRLKRMGSRVVFVMLNPSTADASKNDPTIRRCLAFAMNMDAAILDVVNLYALRATNPHELVASADPVGPSNQSALAAAFTDADILAFAWGATKAPKKRERVRETWATARSFSHVPPKCFGITADGSPRHPLYLRNDAELTCFIEGQSRVTADASGALLPTPGASDGR